MTDPKAVLEEFCVICERVWMDHDLYCSLRERNERDLSLFDAVAPLFFRDVNDILIAHLFVQFAKVTDPPGKAPKANLTSNYILEELPWPNDIAKTLSEINDRLMAFRECIEPARNKRLAHVDLDAQMTKLANLGGFQAGADHQFLNDLQEFIDTAHRHLHNGEPRPIHASMATDTDQLVRTLGKASIYDRCSACSEQDRIAAVLDYEGHAE